VSCRGTSPQSGLSEDLAPKRALCGPRPRAGCPGTSPQSGLSEDLAPKRALCGPRPRAGSAAAAELARRGGRGTSSRRQSPSNRRCPRRHIVLVAAHQLAAPRDAKPSLHTHAHTHTQLGWVTVFERVYHVGLYVISQLGQLSLASLRGRLIEYQLRLG